MTFFSSRRHDVELGYDGAHRRGGRAHALGIPQRYSTTSARNFADPHQGNGVVLHTSAMLH